MPFVISAGTFVTGMSAVQAVSLSLSPQIQRLYQLGSNTPYSKTVINQQQLNITRYAGGASFSLPPSTDCNDASSMNISIAAGGCAGSVGGGGTWYPTSYSYNKDVQGYGMETWGFISAPEIEGGGGVSVRMIRGIAEGQSSTDGGASTGISFVGATIPGHNIEVTAGSPGIGRAFNMVFGEVSSIGGGTGKADGRDGTGSVSCPYTPIYIA